MSFHSRREKLQFSYCEIIKDHFFDKLIEPCDEYDVSTLQALELIFPGLVVKTKRILAESTANPIEP